MSMEFLGSIIRRHFAGGIAKCWLFSQAKFWCNPNNFLKKYPSIPLLVAIREQAAQGLLLISTTSQRGTHDSLKWCERANVNDHAAGLTPTSDKSHNGNLLLFYNCNYFFFSLNVPCWRGLLFLRGLGSVSKVPHNFSGPKSIAWVLTSKTVHFVFLNDGFTISSAKLLNLRSWMRKQQQLSRPLMIGTFEKRAPDPEPFEGITVTPGVNGAG